MAAITLEHLGKAFPGGTRAVSDLNLDIEDGEFMVFVGPSGCGKTTALRMIAGLESITEGTVAIGDRIVNDVPSKDRDVAMVFQNYALYPHLSVADNIGFGLRLRKEPRGEIERRVEEAATILGLEELLERKPRALSGGQRQRVAMGRAIVRQPQAFLMDEPLSNLDAKLRVQMRSEIARIQRTLNVTTIYVTHDQVEAMTMGDRVAVIRKGILQQVASPQQLYDHPVNLFVGGFIGSPAMNMVDATLTRHDGQLFAEFGSHHLAVTEEVQAMRPALADYLDRSVVLGVRPEDIEDASLMSHAGPGTRMSVMVELAEAMGSEVNVHFEIDAPPVMTEDTRELAGDLGADALQKLEAGAQRARSMFVGRISPRTKAHEDEGMEVAVDVSRLYFFDPDTGAAIEDGR